MASTISDILFQFRLFRFHLSRDPASFRRSERLFPDRNRLAAYSPSSSKVAAYNLSNKPREIYAIRIGAPSIVIRDVCLRKEGEEVWLDGAGCRFETVRVRLKNC